MAKIGVSKTLEHPLIQKVRQSNLVELLDVKYIKFKNNVRKVPRSGRRVGNDVYLDIEYVPISLVVKFPNGRTKEISLTFNKRFKLYLNGKITLHEYFNPKNILDIILGR